VLWVVTRLALHLYAAACDTRSAWLPWRPPYACLQCRNPLQCIGFKRCNHMQRLSSHTQSKYRCSRTRCIQCTRESWSEQALHHHALTSARLVMPKVQTCCLYLILNLAGGSSWACKIALVGRSSTCRPDMHKAYCQHTSPAQVVCRLAETSLLRSTLPVRPTFGHMIA
jgi:hypothetical protein